MIVGQKVTKTFPGNQVVQMLGPNPRRVGIIVSSTSTNIAQLAFGENPNTDDGVRINNGSVLPFVLLFDSPNDYITQALNVWTTVGLTLSLVELTDRQA